MVRFGRVFVAGDQCDGAGVPAVRDRDLRGGGGGAQGRHPGDDFIGDAGLAEFLRLLGAAAEDQRVAAL